MKKGKRIVDKLFSYLLILMGFGATLGLMGCPVAYGPPPDEAEEIKPIDLISYTTWLGILDVDGYTFEIILRLSVSSGTFEWVNREMDFREVIKFSLSKQSDNVFFLISQDESGIMLHGTIEGSELTLVNTKTGEVFCTLTKV